jgi:hypothetical protein
MFAPKATKRELEELRKDFNAALDVIEKLTILQRDIANKLLEIVEPTERPSSPIYGNHTT